MKILPLAIACLAISIPAGAQTSAGGTGMLSPNFSTYSSAVEAQLGEGLGETPTMRAQLQQRASALQAEADALRAQDGGTLSAESAAYIRGKACEIVGASTTRAARDLYSRGCRS